MSKALFSLIELRRRKVFRGIGYYLVAAWTLLQVAELVIEPAGLPAWTMTALLYLAVVGFPLAVWLSWRFQLTDKGLERTRPATEADSDTDYPLKTSDYVIFAAMLAVVGAIAWQGLTNIRSEAVKAEAETAAAAEIERELVENSVAVLPFSDLSLDGDQAFMGEGIADTVLHVLSQVKGLTVSARTSSFAFKNRNMTVAQIAGELGVAHVLEGSVQSAGGQLRIIARLIEARTNREMWSGNFDREPREIFAVQDEIAREVVAALQVTVLDDDRERIADQYRPVMEAYEQYILGWRELDQGTRDSIDSSVQRFEKAIETDPDYALAYVGLADAIRSQASVSGDHDLGALRARESELIEKALDLDPALAEAWNLKSRQLADLKQFEAAEAAIRKALELNPNSAEAWNGYWNFQLFSGNHDAALDAIRKAVELDPESAHYQSNLAQQLFDLGRAEEAIYVLRENIRRHVDSPSIYLTLARYLNQIGRPGEAMWYIQAIYRRDPGNVLIHKEICMQHWQLWDMPGAIECMDFYISRVPDDLDARSWQALFKEDLDEAIRIGEMKIKANPNQWYVKMQQAGALSKVSRWEEVVDVVTAAFPDLMSTEPKINDWTQWGARRLAEALLKTGQQEQGLLLIDVTLAHIERSRKLQSGGWMAGPEDALLYALLGEDEKALDSLQRAIDQNWMFYSRAAMFDSAFNTLADSPRFQGLLTRLKQNMARERAWYEEHKNDLQL
jgi:TolB-like protein